MHPKFPTPAVEDIVLIAIGLPDVVIVTERFVTSTGEAEDEEKAPELADATIFNDCNFEYVTAPFAILLVVTSFGAIYADAEKISAKNNLIIYYPTISMVVPLL